MIKSNDSLESLCEFALSFNGYEYVNGGPAELGDLWDRVVPELNAGNYEQVFIDDIRACLFLQQRSDRYHDQYDYESYHAFIEHINRKLSSSFYVT